MNSVKQEQPEYFTNSDTEVAWPVYSAQASMDSPSSAFSDSSSFCGKESKENTRAAKDGTYCVVLGLFGGGEGGGGYLPCFNHSLTPPPPHTFPPPLFITVKKDPGRWTAEEHMLFLKGLHLHGKSWKKISEIVQTRTVVQIRTHAQKYLIKLEKAKKAGHQGVLMMDGKGVDNTERRGTSKKTSSLSGTKPSSSSFSSSSTASSSFTSTSTGEGRVKKQPVQRPAGHLSEQRLQQQQLQHQQQQQAMSSAVSAIAAGAVQWSLAPYPCAAVPSALYTMPLPQPHGGLDMNAPLLSPSFHARASLLASLASRGLNGRNDLVLPSSEWGQVAAMNTASKPLSPTQAAMRLPLEDEMSTAFSGHMGCPSEHHHHEMAQHHHHQQQHHDKPQGNPSVSVMALAAAAATASTHMGNPPLPCGAPSYAVPPQPSCHVPSTAVAPSSFAAAAALSAGLSGAGSCKVVDPLEELMQSLTKGKLSASHSSASTICTEAEDMMPNMHDMNVWELTDKHARPSSLRSWDEEDFEGMSSESSSSGTHGCSPSSVGELQFVPGA